ncbi:vWA domain-containing protein [Allorhodopirellula heiligendammensis]|uniref:VWFA domain-containing protein n=1 Tax=Allorhodopirellula heiligendammensis TaxID=2714739 RepID=A0A5C6C6R1_9BACT|nr:hypothetical protein [Allorhodopirellula heiligendammensis]TWU19156.1 hypothetical protein Poly21_13270 [Allorhodopirellula heiligendammensis]
MTSPESGRSLRPPTTLSSSAKRAALDRDAPPPAGEEHEPDRFIHQRAKILHELVRVRSQAEAARLEAQASRLDASAEQLESLLERIDAGENFTPDQLREFGIDETPGIGTPELANQIPDDALEPTRSPAARQSNASGSRLHSPLARFKSWEAIREAQSRHNNQHVRQDGPHCGVKPPRGRWRTESKDAAPTRSPAAQRKPGEAKVAKTLDTPPTRAKLPTSSAKIKPIDEQTDPAAPQRRSTPVIISCIVHLILLLCLAAFTLSTVMPKDQIALAASANEPSEEVIQTIEIETAQPEAVTSETAPDESVVELDPLGEMTAVKVSVDSLGAATTPSPHLASFSRNAAASSAAMKASPSDSDNRMQFCGVEGGGNHFAYLVDSSGSMGDAFVSARRALLESIDMLKPEQRFYVIFFDAECDYMRITRADQDESRSVAATTVNKQRLKSWAMRVEMDRGKAPYEPLEYALQRIKPDVIFLLSDGEFPQGIEDLLQKENKVTNLFGETKPISIVHTISYHSREGESRMRRIAENNFGQYRHVPKP